MNDKAKFAVILAGSFGAGAGIAHLLETSRGDRISGAYHRSGRMLGRAADLISEKDDEAMQFAEGGRQVLALGLLGGALAVYGLKKQSLLGVAASTVGLTLLGKANPIVHRIVRNPVFARIVPALKGMQAGKRMS